MPASLVLYYLQVCRFHRFPGKQCDTCLINVGNVEILAVFFDLIAFCYGAHEHKLFICFELNFQRVFTVRSRYETSCRRENVCPVGDSCAFDVIIDDFLHFNGLCVAVTRDGQAVVACIGIGCKRERVIAVLLDADILFASRPSAASMYSPAPTRFLKEARAPSLLL